MTNCKEMAYSVIKEKIVTCELMPGALVDQAALMAEIGVSRTPVREAIHALAQEGLLVIMPRRAVVVSSINSAEVGHIYTVRLEFEPFIARLATEFVTEAELQVFRKTFSAPQEDFKTLIRNDFLLHRYLAEKTGNPYLIRLMENVLSQNLRIVALGAKIPDRMADSNKEHIEIIDRMLARDAEGAEAAMRTHMDSAKRVAAIVHRF
jgi:DNA-binding GntR family transcriptional regulator